MTDKLVFKCVTELKPYENNPRNNKNAVKHVASSIKEFGFKVPIVIDKYDVIVAGHTRYEASLELGLDVVPCIIADDLTEEQVRAFRLADNKTGELAEWDFAKLEDELALLDAIDMSSFGFIDNETVEEYFSESEQPTPTERKDLSDRVGECYEVIVECSNEIEQEEIYEKLISEGLKCRVLTL